LVLFSNEIQEKAILPKLRHHVWETIVLTEQFFGAYESTNRAHSLSLYLEAAIEWIEKRILLVQEEEYFDDLTEIKDKLVEAKDSLDKIKDSLEEHNTKSNQLNNEILLLNMNENHNQNN